MTLTQAKAAFQTADHNLQLAWGNGDPAGIRAAVAARTKAYNKVAKMVKAQMAKWTKWFPSTMLATSTTVSQMSSTVFLFRAPTINA